jgi:protein phosphatase
MLEIDNLRRRAESVSSNEFFSLLDTVIDIMIRERNLSRIGGNVINGGLVNLEEFDKLVLVGDLHGDLEAMLSILAKARFFDDHSTLVFLGDYGDRGVESAEVYYTLLYLKAKYPGRIVMLRGNHEGPMDLPFYPHDLPLILESRFGRHSDVIYSRLRDLFDIMYVAVIVKCTLLILHGGLPIKLNSLDDIAKAHLLHPSKSYLLEILWNDPREIKGYQISARGYGYYFGKDVTQHALKVTNTRMLVRAHEPCNGYKVNHDGLVLTIFSCKAPYGNYKASYMLLSKDDLHISNERMLERVEIF